MKIIEKEVSVKARVDKEIEYTLSKFNTTIGSILLVNNDLILLAKELNISVDDLLENGYQGYVVEEGIWDFCVFSGASVFRSKKEYEMRYNQYKEESGQAQAEVSRGRSLFNFFKWE